ncbi:MAG: hypothetical protein HY010_16575 [Acidobacteria bacterium]|nr:hypothetical protein [Acidobacteriota bacterium]
MKDKKTSDEARESFRDVVDALVPSLEELDDEEVANLLESSGIDADAVTAKAHQRLQELAGRRYLSQGKSVPAELRDALHQLKPASFADRVNTEANKAKAAIRSIFDKVKETVALAEPGLTQAAMQPAFRNKKDLTDADRKQLATLQDELDKNDAASTKRRADSE